MTTFPSCFDITVTLHIRVASGIFSECRTQSGQHDNSLCDPAAVNGVRPRRACAPFNSTHVTFRWSLVCHTPFAAAPDHLVHVFFSSCLAGWRPTGSIGSVILGWCASPPFCLRGQWEAFSMGLLIWPRCEAFFSSCSFGPVLVAPCHHARCLWYTVRRRESPACACFPHFTWRNLAVYLKTMHDMSTVGTFPSCANSGGVICLCVGHRTLMCSMWTATFGSLWWRLLQHSGNVRLKILNFNVAFLASMYHRGRLTLPARVTRLFTM